MLSERVESSLSRDYPEASRGRARALIERIPAELGMWSIVAETDRVEAAALAYASGDIDRLGEAIELALRDWRDLLVSVGDG
jgi:hypothetical protein